MKKKIAEIKPYLNTVLYNKQHIGDEVLYIDSAVKTVVCLEHWLQSLKT
jgi:hypothetical protein